jgi:hypothetical protein
VNDLITDPEKKVQGSALYVEMRNVYGNIYQMFFTPDGTNEEGQFTPATVYKRRLSENQPKKQWRSVRLRRELVSPNPEVNPEIHRLERLETIESVLMRLATQYTIVNKPFFVEVSKKDLTDVILGKTPIKIVYRIGQTRKALGFAEMFETK